MSQSRTQKPLLLHSRVVPQSHLLLSFCLGLSDSNLLTLQPTLLLHHLLLPKQVRIQLISSSKVLWLWWLCSILTLILLFSTELMNLHIFQHSMLSHWIPRRWSQFTIILPLKMSFLRHFAVRSFLRYQKIKFTTLSTHSKNNMASFMFMKKIPIAITWPQICYPIQHIRSSFALKTREELMVPLQMDHLQQLTMGLESPELTWYSNQILLRLSLRASCVYSRPSLVFQKESK